MADEESMCMKARDDAAFKVVVTEIQDNRTAQTSKSLWQCSCSTLGSNHSKGFSSNAQPVHFG
eukprot:6457341-Amphidinium_carterae.1